MKLMDKHIGKNNCLQHGFCISGRTVRIETFEQLINLGAGRRVRFQKPTNAKPETIVAALWQTLESKAISKTTNFILNDIFNNFNFRNCYHFNVKLSTNVTLF